jgi:hypothetical protein
VLDDLGKAKRRRLDSYSRLPELLLSAAYCWERKYPWAFVGLTMYGDAAAVMGVHDRVHFSGPVHELVLGHG